MWRPACCYDGAAYFLVQDRQLSEILEKPSEAPQGASKPANRGLIDPYGRRISYLRVSVTDRCDLRCVYCMPERMAFLPRKEVLSLEELERLIRAFMRRGVRKVRLTGGEPLVRKGIFTLIDNLGGAVSSGDLDEVTLTTNGTLLADHAARLADAGVKRINLSLDTLDPDRFHRITRRRKLDDVLKGIDAAQGEGIAIKINTVAMKDENAHEIPSMIEWAHGRGIDLTMIEIMPLGDVDQDRMDQYLPLTAMREDLEQRFTLTPLGLRTGGPARYVRVEETGGIVGFISPLSNNFCDDCNRVRLTCTGQLYMCLGQDDKADFRSVMRSGADDEQLDYAIDAAITRKPKGHEFEIKKRGAAAAVTRRMSATGG